MSAMDYNRAPTIMCLLIINQTNKISKTQLKNAWENNSHGCGMSYKYDNEVIIQKYESFEMFYPDYVEAREDVSTPILLHFRIASSGGRGFDNVHPFYVRENKLSMGHNGTIRTLGDDTMSDSRHLAQILSTFKGNTVKMLEHSGISQMIKAVIGSSKLAFIDAQGGYKIINEHLGHWTANGDWMSNDSYKAVRSYVYQGNKKVSKKSVGLGKTTQGTYKKYKSEYDSKKQSVSTSDLFKDWDKEDEQFDLETNSWVKM